MKALILLMAVVLVGCGVGKPPSFAETKAKAEKGDAVAQSNLGVRYEKGRGVKQDFKEAVKWFRKSAEQGNATGQFNLGVMYAKGRGVPQDFKEAVKWYRKSVEQGNVAAQRNLGFMYANGRGVKRDYVAAYVWWNLAAENGLVDAKIDKSELAKLMTPEQIAKAQELSKEMLKKNPKLLRQPPNAPPASRAPLTPATAWVSFR